MSNNQEILNDNSSKKKNLINSANQKPLQWNIKVNTQGPVEAWFLPYH